METFAKTKYIRVVGPESTGKTTLCQLLATRLHGSMVREFARTYFETHSIHDYAIQDVEQIYRTQQQQEQEAMHCSAFPFLFIDSSFVTAKVWCIDSFNSVPEWIDDEIADEHCDLYLLCEPDIDWVADGQRKNVHNREELFGYFESTLKHHHKNYIRISGKGELRLKNATEAVNELL